MKILYGCCFRADLNIPNVTYVDIIPNLHKSSGIYLCSDIRDICFDDFDIIICTPPCNYYSRANWRRDTSLYSQATKDLLPFCINEAYKTGKPFLIENVRNKNFMYNLDIPKDILIYEYGRHTYFTNVLLNIWVVPQIHDNIHFNYTSARQGGYNVDQVIKCFLSNFLTL